MPKLSFERSFSFLSMTSKALILFMLFATSCQEKKDAKEQSAQKTLFKELSNKTTGVSFANTIEETKRFNLFSYMYFYNGGGVSAGDLNGDGLDDLYFTGNQVSNKLYLNQGNFKFIDVTEQTKTAGNTNSWYTGVTFADVNGDGKLDIYVSQIGDMLGNNGHNLLFINLGNDKNGSPKFKESANEMGLTVKGATTQTAFFDYDLDGDLDAYIMTHSNFNDGVLPRSEKRLISSPYGDKLFRNDGKKFTDVTKESGIYSSTLGFGLGINTADVNKDGYPDIYIGNDFYEDDYLYINNGDGTFTEDLESRIKHTSRFSMGNDIADINNDGLPDILSLDMQAYEPEILKASHGEDSYAIFNYKLSFGYQHQYAHNTFQLNRDGKHFSEIARLAGIEATDWSWSVLANDFDMDGQKDLFITNGIYRRSNDMDYMQFLSGEEVQNQLRSGNYDFSEALTDKMPSYPLQNFFFKNNNDLSFTNTSTAWGGSKKGFSNGAAYTDLDNDGDLDLVVNNLNAEASILKNTSLESDSLNSYLRIKLKGKSSNKYGLGSKVTVTRKGNKKYQELLNVRGYLSSSAPYLNYGVPKNEIIDTIQVKWPNGEETILTEVSAGQELTILQKNSSLQKSESTSTKTLFTALESNELGIDYKHNENRFYEFNREHLTPHMNSTWGPPIAIGDLNNDGLDDFFVGGAQNQAAEIYFQQSNGKFTKSTALQTDAPSEDTASELVDFNGDGYLDILVGSGSNQEIKPDPKSLTRLYINNGRGNFTKQGNFPKIYTTVSDLAIADFDKDGDKDIFISSRSVPGKYGSSPNSYLLKNDGKGNFSVDVESKKYFDKCGMVTSAKWVDLDGDDWQDLVLVGEWMPIKVFYNSNGSLSEANPEGNKLQFSNGWWNTIEYGDFDNDGDIDLVAGNLGLNSKLRATQKEPVQMYYADFDKNGWPEGVTTHFVNGKEHVFSSKSLLEKQMVYLRKKFTTYSAFAQADFKDIFTAEELQNAKTLKAYEFRSCFIENLGNKTFKLIPLPTEAQFSTVNSIYKQDFDEDGKLDLLLGENFYDTNTELGRYDAGHGTLLKNKGRDRFEETPISKSGLLLDKQVRHIKTLMSKKYGQLLIISNNNDSLQFYRR
ncbi:VCBS repeat-containing protein [Zobellia uliginosa]|uniref:VCBS repeat-containing protein n=1 Tax=Zobellia uliginosa TaxID=143224 RepID=UPI001C069B1A|nr:VCBS repeat-containing protein [Zobellia uliginosa]MBU2947798.1 VCBS repeat-containing protein [Zobellia uliginosa]